MILTPADFADATEFERFVLAEAMPLVDLLVPGPSALTYDLRVRAMTQTLVADMAEPKVTAAVARFRPLLVATAWKVLDLVAELALNQAGLPMRGAMWSIATKQQHARARAGTCPPLSTDADLWPRLCSVYAETVELRHCIIHRSFTVGANQDLTALVDRQGAPVRDMTVDEQVSLCAVAQRASDAVIAATLHARVRDDLLWHLDRLALHHGLPRSGARPRAGTMLVIANALPRAGGWGVDIDALRAAAAAAPGRYYEVELHFPGAGVAPLRGDLDAAPSGEQPLDPAVPPAWLR